MTRRPTFENARWFRAVGTCRCGRAATGDLMSNRSDVLARMCERCASGELRAVERAEKARERRP